MIILFGFALFLGILIGISIMLWVVREIWKE